MAIELTVEEQALEDARLAEMERIHQNQIELEKIRSENNIANSLIQHKLELLRHAKDVLIENKRNAPIGERDVTDEDIIKYATSLLKFLEK